MLVLLLVNSSYQAIFPFFHQLFTPLYFAAPACFFLYICHFIGPRKRLSRWEWLHFIPAAMAVMHVIPWPFSPAINWSAILAQIVENKQLFISEKSGLLPASLYYIGRPMLVLGYLLATWYVAFNSKLLKAKEKQIPGKKWILLFLKAATFFQLISFLPLLAGTQDRTFANSIFVVIGCVVLLAIVVFILHRPEIFYSYLFTPADGSAEEHVAKDFVSVSKAAVPLKEPLTLVPASKKVILLPDQSSAYASLMVSFMEKDQPFLLSDFQIIDLAGALNVPVHHCSFVINNVIDKNFRDWINGYRIQHFMVQYPLYAHKKTIEAVAHESGFKSLATFYNAFKKETGLMPKAYFSQKKVS
ncbi:helix-turn-helix domain-containing protein [Pedobacter heparinus]|uniref:helix-turn-helix domain-containing protein n=1 Tax=Pedobacter heparinus TaxID=984 RepID=UPI002930A940|nr:helix-turn-helix domain-containing protein [Pedobacter heparinus]